VVAASLLIALAACGNASLTDGVGSASTEAASASVDASASVPATASPGASGSGSPDAFVCSLPVPVAGTTPRAQITDLQVAAHDGYDRIVYTFAAGMPQVSVEAATPPLTQDASGATMRVEGNAFLRLVLHGGTIQLPAGGVSYGGAVSMTPRFTRLADLQSSGDFEAVNSWYIGLSSQACVRVFTLAGPSRLVIDLRH
jgi:hypothetical protein